MSSDYRIRQRDIIPEEKLDIRVCLIGCGAIGSHTATALAQMGIKYFTLIDPDTVSTENMSSQGFVPSEINMMKAHAVQARIYEHNPEASVIAHTEVFDSLFRIRNPFGAIADILISSVDNMGARCEAYEYAKEQKLDWFIDPRMGAEILTMATVRPLKDEWYTRTLFDDSKGVEERCTAKATIYTALMASALVCKSVKDIITNNPHTEYLTWNIRANQIIDYTVSERSN